MTSGTQYAIDELVNLIIFIVIVNSIVVEWCDIKRNMTSWANP